MAISFSFKPVLPHIVTMEKKTETTIICRGNIEVMLRLILG